ncbi:hypothetical protein [Streptomyces sp. NBC_00091]|uniref:hypothetical protein n=1 Tax=Streptomyces sp. NBC_00091 TaxID=2975648 RepID=UPI002259E884|nr:hypothetical protein [Streptomyces sp. NBC_00091]MCX5379344.1 hypothetical protein [Streptomyces sp. NBC_00091]
MRTSARLSALAPLLVSSLVMGPAAFAQTPDAPARAPAGTCTVAPDAYSKPPTAVKITGKGFTGKETVAIKGDNGYSNPQFNVPAGGNFQINGLPAGTYTVDGVACAGGTPAKPQDQQQPDTNAKAEYDKGYRQGFQAIKANCEAKPPKTALPPDQNWTDGYNAGAALAAKTFCGGQNTGQDPGKLSQHDQGYKKGYDTVQQTCDTKPPKTAVAPDPEWLQGYTEGAAAAAAKFCK